MGTEVCFVKVNIAGKGLPNFVPTLTWQCQPQAEALVSKFGPDAVVADLGAGGRKIAPHVHTVDFVNLPGVSLVADAASTPFADNCADLVIATGLLEHVEDENALISEIFRILKPAGIAHIEVPFLQQYHNDPVDYRRYTLPGIVTFAQGFGFTVINSGVHIGPSVTILTLLTYYISLVFEGKTMVNYILSNGLFLFFSLLFYPIKYLDAYLIKKKNSHRLAFGVFCTLQKR